MGGGWEASKGAAIFGTRERPVGSFLMAGSPIALPSLHSAILSSDPIQCQEGDSFLHFTYWTSPMVKLRVCTRRPSMGRRFDWCSSDITVGDPGPVKVVVPGSIQYTFEIVIEASNFVLSAFGQEGGVAIIDDLIYYASSVYNCRSIPHIEPPPVFPPSLCSSFSCGSMPNSSCLSSLGEDWLLSNSSSSSFHMGIRRNLQGNYAWTRGPSTSSLLFPSFSLPSDLLLEFCVYSPSEKGLLTLFATFEGTDDRSELFRLPSSTGHNWACNSVPLGKGSYKWLEFSVDGLDNEWSVMGMDEISLISPSSHQPICRR
ncbi:hypothetical protein PMAYCL1PPCAC_02530 [Pristionchus mayeri]|uniref:MAM domain-containing protein n=1 Tax=Pristionchus mayeri TaxID=1317129 RepID=A0AAN4Z6W7_9BILA|nr:hypothetical protein PMAYCL1PPCAC_02530 [Pristionchus mayeri]